MIIPPYIFRKIQRETFLANTTLSSKSPFQISPESFKSIYVITLLIRVFTLAMFYQTMYIALGSDSRITFPRIRANRRTWLYMLLYKGNKSFCFDIWHNLSPYLPLSAQDSKYRSFLGSSPSLCKTDSLRSPFVLPLSSQICFIDFNCSTEYSRNIFYHCSSHYQQCPQYSLSLNACFKSDIMARKALKKRHQQSMPLRFHQMKGQTVRFPLVFATQATPLEPAYYIGFRVIAFWTSISFCHATNVSYLVAEMVLYPYYLF
jgi:hypothetical protein